MEESLGMDRIYVDYDRAHHYMRALFEKLKPISSQGAILIAVARGGWLSTRILAASYEDAGIATRSYSISATYKKHGFPDEYVELIQVLDNKAVQDIRRYVEKGIPIIIVDSVSQTGRELLAIKKYLNLTFPEASVYVATMVQVRYSRSSRTPWRSTELVPDFYGCLIEHDQMPYIEFPWEYYMIDNFNKHKVGK